jgi:hypothetical protein
VFGLESVRDAEGNIIREAPLPVWANFQQRAARAFEREVARGAAENRESGSSSQSSTAWKVKPFNPPTGIPFATTEKYMVAPW